MLLRFHRDALVLQDPDLNAPILLAPFCSVVIGDGLALTIPKWLDQASQIQIVHADQVLNDGLRASFAKRAILSCVAGCIRKANYFNEPTVRVSLSLFFLGPGCRVINRLLGGSVNQAAIYFEENRIELSEWLSKHTVVRNDPS